MTISVDQAEQYLKEGHFAAGSMGPKIKAAIHFIRNGGKETIITESTQLGNPDSGTKIVASVINNFFEYNDIYKLKME
jgi:carbamate kinase